MTRQRIAQRAKATRHLLTHVSSLTDEAKKEVGTPLRRHINRVAAADIWTAILDSAVELLASALILVGGWAIAILVATQWWHVEHSSSAWPFVALGYVTAFVILVFVSEKVIPDYNPPRHAFLDFEAPVIFTPAVATVCAAGAAAYSLGLGGGAPHWLWELAGFGLVAIGGMVALTVPVWSVLAGTLLYPLDRRRRDMFGESIVIRDLLFALVLSDSATRRWWDGSRRRWLAHELDSLANALMVDLPRFLACGRHSDAEWLKQQLAPAASTIRQLKRQALLPRSDTSNALGGGLARAFMYAANSDWAGLADMGEMEPLVAPDRRRERAVQITRVVAIAALPISFLAILQLTPLALSGAYGQAAVTVTLVWAAMTTLSVLDPFFWEKAAFLRGVLRGTSGTHEDGLVGYSGRRSVEHLSAGRAHEEETD